MEEIAKERTVTDYYYKSFDGKLFDSKEECRRYEENETSTFKKELFLLPHVEVDKRENIGLSYCVDDYIVNAFCPKDEKELHIINRYYNSVSRSCNAFPLSAVGHLFYVAEYEDWVNIQDITQNIEDINKNAEESLKKISEKSNS